MGADMSTGGGFKYQWILSLYLYTLLKRDDYILDRSKQYTGKKFWLFVDRINKFKNKCIKEYGSDFNLRFEVLVEGDEKCLDDITFLSENDGRNIDNNIFIQVKTKGGDESVPITTSDGIYKAVRNFLSNLNFQNNKNNGNILFFIFVNKALSDKTSKIFKTKGPELYLSFIDNICNNKPLKIYPQKSLDKLNKVLNKELVIDLLNDENIFSDKYMSYYGKEYLEQLKILIGDLKIMFEKLELVEEIDYKILKGELIGFYGELDFYLQKDRIEDLCWEGDEIIRGTQEFMKYEKYKYTYFLSNDGGQTIDKIDVITKGKFI